MRSTQPKHPGITLRDLIPDAVRERQFRAHSFAASLTPDQRALLFQWLHDYSYSQVIARVAAPAPQGFGLRVSQNTLVRLKHMLNNVEVTKRVASAMDAACDLADSGLPTNIDFLRETLIVQLYSRAVSQAGTGSPCSDINQILSAIAKIEKIKAHKPGRAASTRRLKIDLAVSRSDATPSTPQPQPLPPTAPASPIPLIDAPPAPRLVSVATSYKMLPVIENLLILQDRDRKIMRIEAELANLAPERASLDQRAQRAQAQAEAGKTKARQLEADRKKLELDVEAKKGLIEKYSLQQFQTKKNEEYRALAHEIENCKSAISKLDDEQLLLMEQVDIANRESAEISKSSAAELKDVELARTSLVDKEARLRRELEDLKSDYARLEEAVEESVRDRYVRLRKQRGATAVVGIDRGFCGGCHMKLPMQVILTCQAQQEIVTCTQCSRILYFTREMDLAVA
jgi:predicted  nucleic acid-binding Zn-ribbon protein